MLARVATLNGPGLSLTFRENDEEGRAESILTGLSGWYGGVGTKGDDEDRPLGHGLFASPSTRTARVLTLRGTVLFQSEEDRAIADRILSGVLWDGEFGTLTVYDMGNTLTAVVKLDGPVKHEFLGTRSSTVEISLIAPDPFLYAEERTYQINPAGYGEGLQYPLFGASGVLTYGGAVASSYVAITNDGNAEAWPRFAVRGTFPTGFRIVSEGRTIEYPHATYPQSPVFIDTATGAVTINGRDQTTALTKREWFSIPPRGIIQPRLIGLEPGDGWADVVVSDTYI